MSGRAARDVRPSRGPPRVANRTRVGPIALCGERSQGENQPERLLDDVGQDSVVSHDRPHAAVAEILEVVSEDRAGELSLERVVVAKLEDQALLEARRPDAGRLAGLKQGEGGLGLLKAAATVERGFFDRRRQVSTLVEAPDEVFADASLFRRELREELGAKVIGERVFAGGKVGPVGVVRVVREGLEELAIVAARPELSGSEGTEDRLPRQFVTLFAEAFERGILHELVLDCRFQFGMSELKKLTAENDPRIDPEGLLCFLSESVLMAHDGFPSHGNRRRMEQTRSRKKCLSFRDRVRDFAWAMCLHAGPGAVAWMPFRTWTRLLEQSMPFTPRPGVFGVGGAVECDDARAHRRGQMHRTGIAADKGIEAAGQTRERQDRQLGPDP